MVYDNPEKTEHHGAIVQPARCVELQYEILVAIIVISGSLATFAVLYMMYGKGKRRNKSKSSTAV